MSHTCDECRAEVPNGEGQYQGDERVCEACYEVIQRGAEEAGHFAYLERLRESGVVNGSGPYMSLPSLRDMFGLTKREAKAVVKAWINSKRQTSDDGQGEGDA